MYNTEKMTINVENWICGHLDLKEIFVLSRSLNQVSVGHHLWLSSKYFQQYQNKCNWRESFFMTNLDIEQIDPAVFVLIIFSKSNSLILYYICV